MGMGKRKRRRGRNLSERRLRFYGLIEPNEAFAKLLKVSSRIGNQFRT